MSLPLGHFAVGITTHELCANKSKSSFREWKILTMIALLANLPDIDVVLGLLFQANGNAFHRGPTHSLLFALMAATLVANAARILPDFAELKFKNTFLIIFSHIMADFFLTGGPVSFFWPFEMHLSTGFRGWGDVVHTVFYEAYQDLGLIMICGALVICYRLVRSDYIRSIPKLKPEFIRVGFAETGEKKKRKSQIGMIGTED